MREDLEAEDPTDRCGQCRFFELYAMCEPLSRIINSGGRCMIQGGRKVNSGDLACKFFDVKKIIRPRVKMDFNLIRLIEETRALVMIKGGGPNLVLFFPERLRDVLNNAVEVLGMPVVYMDLPGETAYIVDWDPMWSFDELIGIAAQRYPFKVPPRPPS